MTADGKVRSWTRIGAIAAFGALTVAIGAAAAPGCASNDSNGALPTSGPNTQPGGKLGPCQPGTMQKCGIELGSHGGQIQCATGTQICQSGRWSPCQPDASLGTRSVPIPVIKGQAKLGLQTVGGASSSCLNDPCDPYCQGYNDAPDAAIQSDASVTTLDASTGGTLANSNVPSGFQMHGSENSRCANPCNTVSCMSACQFDQHCVNGSCTGFATLEQGSCTGVDITVPTTCISSDGNYIEVSVCNRGTQQAPAGIRCWDFSGGSPQFQQPNADPFATYKGTPDYLGATSGTIDPGYCETMYVPIANFHDPGTTSVMCNPPENSGTGTPGSTGKKYATSYTLVAGEGTWLDPTFAYAAETPAKYATATLPDPSTLTTSGTRYPTVSADFDPAFGSWTNGPLGFAKDGLYATATPGTPTASSGTSKATPTADDQSLGDAAYTPNDGQLASFSVAAKGTGTIKLSGLVMSPTIPDTATISSASLAFTWNIDTSSASSSATVTVTVYDGTTSLGTASATAGGTLTIPLIATAANLTSSSLKAVVSVANGSNSKALLVDVDGAELDVAWTNNAAESAVLYGNFGLQNYVPSGATITKLTATGVWHVDTAANAGATIRLDCEANGGTIAGATIIDNAPSTSDATKTISVVNPSISAADLYDGTFDVVVRAEQTGAAPFTASLDVVDVSVDFTVPTGSLTYAMVLGNFGLGVPSNATITGVTVTSVWKRTTATQSTLGMQAYAGTTPFGTEVTNAGTSTSTVTLTQTFSGGTAADYADGTFQVNVRATR